MSLEDLFNLTLNLDAIDDLVAPLGELNLNINN